MNLRVLRILVTVLTVVMIVGLITIVAVFVTRFPSGGGELMLPEAIELPDGITAEAVTFGADWIAVISGDQILIYDRMTGTLRQSVDILD